jgi:pyruvate,water dikinase
MLGQRLMTDNRRLAEAKRRAGALSKQAARLPTDSPRRALMSRLAAAVQVRVVAAALVPVAVLLGPMVMTFVWLPNRVDPASWNAPPGSSVSVVATIDSNLRAPVTLTVAAPLHLDESSPSAQTLLPIRQTLERLVSQWQRPLDTSNLLLERVREETLADLRAYLARGVPPQKLAWRIHSQGKASGRFPVTLSTDRGASLTAYVVLGDQFPPGQAEAFAAGASPLISTKVVYPPPEQPRYFWRPLAGVGLPHWEAGWLLTYLVVYLPVMFGLRWMLGVV